MLCGLIAGNSASHFSATRYKARRASASIKQGPRKKDSTGFINIAKVPTFVAI
jgi:hypothetical protein